MTNAIMQRIEQMSELWEQFAADPAGRLACWRLDHDSTRMFDLFLELQNEEASDLPDLFIRCSDPLVNAAEFGCDLRKTLIEKYDEIREGIESEGIPAVWQCPARRSQDDDIDSLLAACDSLQSAHESIVRHVVLAVLPHSVSSSHEWHEWLRRLVAKSIPEQVRFLVVDNAAEPQLAELGSNKPGCVVKLQPELKMSAAYLELLRDVPGSGPGFVFRRFFVALGNAVSSGNINAAKRLAEQATRIATQQKWTHLQTTVAMTLGSAYLARNDFESAIRCYAQGQNAVAGQQDEVSSKVMIQAKFAEASALLAAARPAEAAKVYDQIKALAKDPQESFARFESARMCAYCHEQTGNRENAWKSGVEALALAESMAAQSVRAATLPYAGQALLRAADGSHRGEADEIRQRLDKLLGKNWEAALQQESAS